MRLKIIKDVIKILYVIY